MKKWKPKTYQYQRKKFNKDLTKTAKEAAEHGLTYGYWVGKQYADRDKIVRKW